MAFAAVTDVEARWRELSPDEKALVSVKLDDATTMLTRLVDVDDADDAQAELLKYVCCSMVIRSIDAAAGTLGVSQSMTVAGPYSQQLIYSNPTGELFLTKQEKLLLGIGGRFGFARPSYGVLEARDD